MADVVLLSSDDEPESRKMRNRVQECMNSPDAYPGLQVHVKSQVNGSDATTSSAKIPDPEEVITEIELLISGGHNLKTAFTTLSCRCVSIGSYRVTSTGPHELGLGPDLRLTFSEVGILFHLPHCETNIIQKCAVASHQILTVYVNFHDASAVFVIVTGPKFATWMRQRLGMNHDSSAELFYCPLNGDETQKHLTFMVPSLSEIDASIIRRIYGRNLVEWDVALCKVFLKKICLEPMEDYSSQSSLIKPTINNKSRVECASEEFQTINGEVHKLFQYPEAGLKESIVVHSSDVACLAEEQFLNDQIIDFYLRYFLDSLSDEERNRSYVYNTFFYKRLTTRPKRKSSAPWEFDPALSVAQKRHARVKSWTKRIDIFEKDYLFVPINESAHWFLAVICFPGLLCPALFRDDTSLPWMKNARKKSRRSTRTARNVDLGEPNGASADGDQLNASSCSVLPKNTTNLKQRIKQPCILLFDSLAGGTRSRVYSTLREYLRVEYKVRKGEDRYFDRRVMPGYQPRVPQQPNNCDCGVYSIQYAESFFTSPIQSFYFPLCSLLNWFPETSMHSKRKEIYDIIINLINTKYPENASFVPKLNFMVEDPGWNSSDEHASDSAEVPMDVDESSNGESALTKNQSLTSQVLCTPPLNTLIFSPSSGIGDIRFSNDKKIDIVPPDSKKTKLK